MAKNSTTVKAASKSSTKAAAVKSVKNDKAASKKDTKAAKSAKAEKPVEAHAITNVKLPQYDLNLTAKTLHDYIGCMVKIQHEVFVNDQGVEMEKWQQGVVLPYDLDAKGNSTMGFVPVMILVDGKFEIAELDPAQVKRANTLFRERIAQHMGKRTFAIRANEADDEIRREEEAATTAERARKQSEKAKALAEKMAEKDRIAKVKAMDKAAKEKAAAKIAAEKAKATAKAQAEKAKADAAKAKAAAKAKPVTKEVKAPKAKSQPKASPVHAAAARKGRK